MSDDFGMQVYQALRELRPLALKLTRDADHVDDLIQSTAVRALAGRHLFQPGTVFKAWLYTILRNIFLSELRARRRSRLQGWDDACLDVADPVAHRVAEARIDMERAVASIPPTRRNAVLLVAVGHKYREVAVRLGIPRETVKSRVYRARPVGN